MKYKSIIALSIVMLLSGTGNVAYASTKDSKRPINPITVNKANFQVLKNEEIPVDLKNKIEINKEKKGYISLMEDKTGYLYVAILYGARPTTGYSIGVNYVEDNEGRTNIFISENKPSPDYMQAQVITYPYTVIRVQGVTPNVTVINQFNEKYDNLSVKEQEPPVIGAGTITGKVKNYEEKDKRKYLTIEDAKGNLHYFYNDRGDKGLDKKLHLLKGDNVIVKYALGTPVNYKGNAYLPFKNIIKLKDKDKEKNWKDLKSYSQVPKDKEWSIKFENKILDKNVNTETVYILNSKGNRFPITVSLQEDKKTIKIKPIINYNLGETYYLYISRNVQPNDIKENIEGYRMKFTVEEDVVINIH